MPDMATRIRKSAPQPPRKPQRFLRLDEWFAFRGVNDEKVAKKMEPPSNRETINRYRNGITRVSPAVQARLAKVLDCEPSELWSLPPTSGPSIDTMIKDANPEQRALITDLVQRILKEPT